MKQEQKEMAKNLKINDLEQQQWLALSEEKLLGVVDGSGPDEGEDDATFSLALPGGYLYLYYYLRLPT